MSVQLTPEEDWKIQTVRGEPWAVKQSPPELWDKRGKTPKKKGEVTFSASCRYNGGIVVMLDGVEHWVKGFDLPPPNVPEGFRLRSIGVGHQLNCWPPYATQFLEEIE